MKNIDHLVEELAVKLVEADSSNLQDITKLHVCFQQFSEEASRINLKLVTAAASAAESLTKKIILGKVTDRDAAFDLLAQTVTFIQAVVRDGRKEEEVPFYGITLYRYAKRPASLNTASE